ncbi:hypothetical protein EO087_10545 [Dyella sp. M7H15-1]|nr:hypothetical protein EO087_07055 [Dyella sp. M7H15-1]QAU24375.1 hypothetical protein EO087_10545 [Dyella sp. M7H15-1]
MEGLSPDEYEVIGEKISHRLAMRPSRSAALRAHAERRDTQALSCPPAPTGVLEGSRADVSFIAGTRGNKCRYHVPLHRQWQHLKDTGIDVSRGWLTQLSRHCWT